MKLMGALLESRPLKFVCVRCSVAFALHHRVVILFSCPGSSVMPRPLRVPVCAPSKKSVRSLMVICRPPVFFNVCSYVHVFVSAHPEIG